jgi:hypothetical protein
MIQSYHDRHLVERFDHRILVCGVDMTGISFSQTEDTLDDRELSRRCVETSDSHPVVDDHTRTNNRTTSVHTTGDERDLEQTGKLVLVLDRCFGVHNTTLIAQSHVRACEDVVRDCLPEHLHAENICYYFLGLALNVGVNKCDVVVAADDVAES